MVGLDARRNDLKRLLGLGRYELNDPVDAFFDSPSVRALSCVPRPRQTPEMVRIALESPSAQTSPILKYVSKKLLSYELCLKAVSRNAQNLRFVPQKWQSKEIRASALSQDGWLILDIPSKERDAELYEIAVKEDGLLLGKVPARWLSMEMCECAVLSDGMALRYIPEGMRMTKWGQRICLKALEQNPLAIQFIPEIHLNEELVWSTVRRPPIWYGASSSRSEIDRFHRPEDWPIRYIPEAYMCKELCDCSRELFPSSIAAVPDKFLSDKICLGYLETEGASLENIPERFRRKKQIIECALEALPEDVRYVPEDMQTAEMWASAVSANPEMYIPVQFSDCDIVLKAKERAVQARRDAALGFDPYKVVECDAVVQ